MAIVNELLNTYRLNVRLDRQNIDPVGIKGDRFIHAITLIRDMTKCNASHSL